MFEGTKIVLVHFYWSCVVKCANISFIWALDFVFYNKTHYITYILKLMSIQYKLKFTSIFQICLVCLFFPPFFQKGYWYWILILLFFRHTDTDHTSYSRNIMCLKCGGDCGLWVLNEIIQKKYPESLKKIVGALWELPAK